MGIQTAASELSRIAQEPVSVEEIKGVIYGFCSELGVLRLFHRYNLMKHNPKVRAGFSANKDSWYFSIET